MDVKRRGHPPGSDLLDEREATPGPLGGGLEGREGPEEPEGLSVPRAERVGGEVGVHALLLVLLEGREP